MLQFDGIDDEAPLMGFEDAPSPELVSCEPPRLKVLVVEDDPAALLGIEICLAHMALFEPQITIAGSTAAAQFAARADDFDVILVDENMCAGRGAEFLYALGDHPDRCPILLLTSDPSRADKALSAASPVCLGRDDLSAKTLEKTIHQAICSHAQQCTLSALAPDRFAGVTAD